jgi:hypothetical protein
MTQHTFDVSAGIGFFNGSQALDFSFEEVSLIFATTFNYVLVDSTWGSRFNSSSCLGADCISYYFPGTLNEIYPSPDGFDSAEVSIVTNVQGLQIDFWFVDEPEIQSINNTYFDDCPIYGGPRVAFRICISPSSLNVDHLIIGTLFHLSADRECIALWVCPFYNTGRARLCLNDSSWYQSLPETAITAMHITRHIFDVQYSRLNQTILSVASVRPTTPQTIAPEGIYLTLGQTFGVPGSLSDTDNSTTATLVKSIWSSVETTNGQDMSTYLSLLQSMITTEILLFNPNSVNAYKDTTSINSTAQGLPSDLYTKASYAKPVGRVIIERWTVVVYIVIALSIYLWCIGVLAWGIRIQKPQTSRFPLVDFTSRVLSRGFSADSVATILIDLTSGNDKEIRERLWNKVLFLGDVYYAQGLQRGRNEDGKVVGKIGFSTVQNVAPLKSGEVYE